MGGVEKNKTGMISDARALQSVIQLMGPRDMLEYWSNTYKVMDCFILLKTSRNSYTNQKIFKNHSTIIYLGAHIEMECRNS